MPIVGRTAPSGASTGKARADETTPTRRNPGEEGQGAMKYIKRLLVVDGSSLRSRIARLEKDIALAFAQELGNGASEGDATEFAINRATATLKDIAYHVCFDIRCD